MPKKNPINGFALFMKDLLNDMNLQRKRDFYTLADMSEIASPKWQALPAHIKSNYNDKARELKSRKGESQGRLTSDGVPLEHIIAAEEDEKRKIKQMLDLVRNIISNCKSIEDVSQMSFYVISFNILVATQEGAYIPIEVGLIEYSIRDGLKKSFHRLIDPGPIPIGYTSDAKMHSNNTHKIPIMGSSALDNCYSKIFDELIDFANVRKNKQIFFTHGDQLQQNYCCYEWLKLMAGYEGPDNVEFADISMLLFELRGITNNPLPVKSIADDMLRHSGFDFAQNSRCDFHEEMDNQFCALGYSRKLCFILSDALADSFQLTVTTKHVPEVPDEHKYTEKIWEPLTPLRPYRNAVNVPIKPIVERETSTIVKNIKSRSFDYEEKPTITPSSEAEIPEQPMPQLEELDEFPQLTPQSSSIAAVNNVPNTSVWSQRNQIQMNPGCLGVGRGKLRNFQ